MSLKYLNLTGLSRVVTNLKNWVVSQIPTKTSEITNDSGFITGTSDCVHIAGNETITGEKTFSGNHVWITNSTTKYLFLKNTSWDLGQATPSSDVVYGGYVWRDKDNQDVAQLRYIDWSNGYSGIRLLARTKFTNGVKDTTGSNVDTILDLGTMPNGTRYLHTNALFHDSVIPDIGNSLTLGNTTYKWKAVYSNAYYLGSTAFGDIVTHNSSEYSLSSHTHTKSEITDFPTIPTVNNATLTIQRNGTTVKTFTANASSNVTCNITVPTKTSEITNDSGFLSNTIINNTSKGALGWSSSIGTNIPTLNTLAYWNGAYTNTTSNLAYCVKGAFGDIVTHAASEFLTSHQDLSLYPYKETSANNWEYLNLGDTTTYPTGFDGVTDNGRYHIRATADTQSTPVSGNIGGLLIVDHISTEANVSSYGRCTQIFFRLGASATFTIYLRRGYITGGTYTWQAWEQLAKTGDIPTKTSELTNDSGFITSSSSITGNAANVTGTVAIAHGGTGATTRLNAVKALTNENVGTDTDYFLTITSSWGKAGYCSVANAKTVLGLQSGAYAEAYVHPTTAGNKHIPSGGSTGQILRYSASGTAVWANRGAFVAVANRTSTGTWTATVTNHCIYLLLGSMKQASGGGSITITSGGTIIGGYTTPAGNASSCIPGGSTIYSYAGASDGTTIYFRVLIFSTATSMKFKITDSLFSDIDLDLCV